MPFSSLILLSPALLNLGKFMVNILSLGLCNLYYFEILISGKTLSIEISHHDLFLDVHCLYCKNASLQRNFSFYYYFISCVQFC